MALRAAVWGIYLETCSSHFLALTSGPFNDIFKPLNFAGTPRIWGLQCSFCIQSFVYVELRLFPFLSANSTTLDDLVPTPQSSDILSSHLMSLFAEKDHTDSGLFDWQVALLDFALFLLPLLFSPLPPSFFLSSLFLPFPLPPFPSDGELKRFRKTLFQPTPPVHTTCP